VSIIYYSRCCINTLTLALSLHSFARVSFGIKNFIDSWHTYKANASAEPLTYGDTSKKKTRASPLAINTQKCVRTLRFERLEANGARYHIFNVYDVGQGKYSAVYRWGAKPDTAENGETLQFSLGNKEAAQQFIKDQIPHIVQQSALTTDYTHPSFEIKPVVTPAMTPVAPLTAPNSVGSSGLIQGAFAQLQAQQKGLGGGGDATVNQIMQQLQASTQQQGQGQQTTVGRLGC
jgi:hypothetical protein